MKALEHISTTCDATLQPIAVGLNGRDDVLLKEVRRAKITFPSAKVSTALLGLIGDVPATPLNVIAMHDGSVAAIVRGFVEQETLAAVFPEYCPAADV